MRYYSDILEKFYEDVNVLKKEEREFLTNIDKTKKSVLMDVAEKFMDATDEKVNIPTVNIDGQAIDLQSEVKRKKELANKIAESEKSLEQAYQELEEAKEQCKAIIEESNKMMEEVLAPAKTAVKNAEQERLNAITEFNKEFGVYKTVYTGEKASKEFNRAMNRFNDIFNKMFLF